MNMEKKTYLTPRISVVSIASTGLLQASTESLRYDPNSSTDEVL